MKKALVLALVLVGVGLVLKRLGPERGPVDRESRATSESSEQS